MQMLTVIKEGHDVEMSEMVWEMIGKENNKEGYTLKAQTPPEIIELKSKKQNKVSETTTQDESKK